MENFLKLTKIPTVIYFGDNIPKGDTPVANWGQDNWRVRWNLAKKWEAVMRSYGADVSVVSLPDIGIKGSTHFMMADLNNREVADAMLGITSEPYFTYCSENTRYQTQGEKGEPQYVSTYVLVVCGNTT